MTQEKITFEQICEKIGLDPNKVLPDVSMMPEHTQKAVLAFAKRCIAQEYFNGDWEADWSDSSQRKYHAWPDAEVNENSPSGFALSCIDCVYDRGNPGLGSRLYFKDPETVKIEFETFEQEWNDMTFIPKKK